MAVAAHVTTQAPIKLYEYLSKFGESVPYCVTDNVIFIQKVDEAPKVGTGDYLSHLTHELEEFGICSFIEEFVSGGLKTICFLFPDPQQENARPNVRYWV